MVIYDVESCRTWMDTRLDPRAFTSMRGNEVTGSVSLQIVFDFRRNESVTDS